MCTDHLTHDAGPATIHHGSVFSLASSPRGRDFQSGYISNSTRSRPCLMLQDPSGSFFPSHNSPGWVFASGVPF